MSAAARVTLTDLLNEDRLEQVPVDPDVCRQLLTQASNHLRTAASGIAGGDNEGGFQLAHDANRKACLALVLAIGHRPIGRGSHATTFEAAATIASNFGARQVVDDASNLRFVRNNAEYEAETIDDAAAMEAVEIGTDLLAVLRPAIDKILQAT